MGSPRPTPIVRFTTLNSTHDAYSERLVTAIGSQPFYQSTGENSQSPNTFFPFDGVKLWYSTTDKCWLSWLIKPKHKANDLESYYPQDFRSFIFSDQFNNNHKLLETLLRRMGNFEKLILSMIIGEGLWNTGIGKNIQQFISNNYYHNVHDLIIRHGKTIVTIQSALLKKQYTHEVCTQDKFKTSLDEQFRMTATINNILKEAIPSMSFTPSLYKLQNHANNKITAYDPVPNDYTLQTDALIPGYIMQRKYHLKGWLDNELKRFDETKKDSKAEILTKLIKDASKEVLEEACKHPYFKRNSMFAALFSSDNELTDEQKSLQKRMGELNSDQTPVRSPSAGD